MRVLTSVDPREPVAPVMRIVLDEIALADIFVSVEDYSSIKSSLKFSTFHEFRPSELCPEVSSRLERSEYIA